MVPVPIVIPAHKGEETQESLITEICQGQDTAAPLNRDG